MHERQHCHRPRSIVKTGALAAVDNTPLVRLSDLPDPGGGEVWLKWEGANPIGGMKDRMALGMIEEAERTGKLRPGMRVVESTGGSTGTSLATDAASAWSRCCATRDCGIWTGICFRAEGCQSARG